MTAAKKAAPSDIPTDKLIRLYHQMVAIRLFEERVNDLYTRALMPGLAHLYDRQRHLGARSRAVRVRS